jgi:tRNA(adenine34) deaminase
VALISNELAHQLMSEALKEAAIGALKGEVPVGAVLAVNGSIVARAHNLTESASFVGAHAEMLVIQEASKQSANWRLTESVLCVTLEPCTMCFGAIRLSRIPTVIYGAGDSRQGAVGSLFDLSTDTRLGPPIKVIRNCMAEDCSRQLKDFFSLKRNNP